MIAFTNTTMLRSFFNLALFSIIPLFLSAQDLTYFGPTDVLGNELTYPIDGFSFTPSNPPTNIGDINGDGFDDMLQNQSLIYLGSNELTLQPFQVMEGNILAIGDINGDGYSDAIGSTFSGSDYSGTLYKGSESGLVEIESPGFDEYFSTHVKGQRYLANKLTVLTNVDFNSDGFSDIVSSYNASGIRYTIITYGSKSIFETGFSKSTSTISNNQNLDFGFFLDFFEQEGKKYFAFETCVNEPKDEFDPFNTSGKLDIKIFELTDSDSLKLNAIERFPYYNPGSNCSFSTSNKLSKILLEDVNSDQKKDVIYHYQGNVFVQSGLGVIDDTLRFNNPFDENFISDAVIDSISEIHLIGDLNEDGIPEFQYLEYDGTNLSIGNFNFGESSTEWSNLLTLSSSDFLSDSYFTTGSNIFVIYNKNYSWFFDIPDSDNKILVLGARNDVSFEKYQLQFSSPSDDFFNDYTQSKVSSNLSDYSRIVRKELFYLGDLEQDDVDNFATWEDRFDGDYIVYRNGFYSEETPEFKIPDSLNLKTIVSGNFISTSKKNVVHLYNTNRGPTNSYLFFFDTSTINETPVLILELNGDLDFLNTLGDLNNDGLDEFGLSSKSSGFLIFKGASNFTVTPDFEINPDQYLNNVGADRSSSSLGITLIQSVDDLNDDSFDDFIISDPSRLKFYDFDNNYFTDGSLYLFYGGGDESFEYSVPDFEFLPDTTSFTSNSSSRFGGLNEVAYGDFDGDGLTDFAAKAAKHTNPERTNGIGAIQIYYAKGGYKAIPDTTIPIRSEYVYSSNQSFENEYVLEMYHALMKAVDVNSDGKDELLLVSGGGLVNAVLYNFDNGITEEAEKIFKGLNDYPLNPSRNSTVKQYNSLVGDFVGDGGLYFLGHHTISEEKYRDSPILLFDLIKPNPISTEINEQPEIFSLFQNYPNPFNPTTSISFSLPKATEVNLFVYNLLGQKVATIIQNKRIASGKHSVTFNASNLSSGVYLYRLETGSFMETKKMLLIK